MASMQMLRLDIFSGISEVAGLVVVRIDNGVSLFRVLFLLITSINVIVLKLLLVVLSINILSITVIASVVKVICMGLRIHLA